jgi:L-asparaginase
MKKILILHTGGTFGMERQETHAHIDKQNKLLDHLIDRVPELSSIAVIDVKVLCNIDSSNANEKTWKLIANTIFNEWNDFDGFVVIHGTDTMAWTACALAYFLNGLTKSVVITGAQLPLIALRNDARMNIIDSVELATYGIPEVMLCFDSKVHKATRATKYSNEHLHAFRSYNAPLIGEFGVNFKLNKKNSNSIIPLMKRHAPTLNLQINTQITTLLAIPGTILSKSQIKSIIQNTKGILIIGFGSGNLPTENDSWINLCKLAFENSIPVIMGTQCDSGYVNLSLYENGRIFEKLGVISSLDMSIEASSIKLMIYIGRKIPFDKREEFFSTPLAYECLKLN